jgi:hypothetical protein
MRYLYSLFFFLLIWTSVAHSQNAFTEGNTCFKAGDYNCAIAKYEQVLRDEKSSNKQIAEINLSRAKACANWLLSAKNSVRNKDYATAIDYYQKIVSENPDDSSSKDQIRELTVLLKSSSYLELDTISINFTSDSGSIMVHVRSNPNTYGIKELADWCIVQSKKSDSFVLNCTRNTSQNSRTNYFKVFNTEHEIVVQVTQRGSTSSTSTNNITNSTTNERAKSTGSTPRQSSPKSSNEIVYNSKESFFSIGYEGGEIARYGIRIESGGEQFVGIFLNVRSTLIKDDEILGSSTHIDNMNEGIVGINFRINRYSFVNIGAGYGYSKSKISDGLTMTDYYPLYGGLTFRLGRRFNLSGGASFKDIQQSISSSVYDPEITFGLTVNLIR